MLIKGVRNYWIKKTRLRRREIFLRRERDSNPRGLLHPNGFQDRRNRPLCHLSGGKSTIFLLFSNKKLALGRNCFKKRIFTTL